MSIEIPADRPVDINLLVPGAVVWRYTEPVGVLRAIRTELPCHDDQTVTILRDQIEGLTTGGEHQFVVCRECATAYRLMLATEPPEETAETAYTAGFLVAYEKVVISRRTR